MSQDAQIQAQDNKTLKELAAAVGIMAGLTVVMIIAANIFF